MMKPHSALPVPLDTALSGTIEDAQVVMQQLSALTEAVLHPTEAQVLFHSIGNSGLQSCHSSEPHPALTAAAAALSLLH